MKKIMLCLALLGSTNHLLGNNSSDTNIPFLQEYEYMDLHDLYSTYKKDPSLFKTYGSGFIHSRLILLEKHIQILEDAQQPENILKKKNGLLAGGVLITGMLGLASFILIKNFIQSYTEFKSKKFKEISIPFSWIENLPDKQFSPEQKRYLKKFSFEKIKSRGNEQGIGNIVYTDILNADISDINPHLRKNFSYLALDYNIPLKKRAVILQGLISTGTIASAAGLALYFLYQIFYQEDLLKEQLKEAKRIHKFLQLLQNSHSS